MGTLEKDSNHLVQVMKDRKSINHRNPHPLRTLLENHSIHRSLVQEVLTHEILIDTVEEDMNYLVQVMKDGKSIRNQ